jgi:hypothetical protein
MKNALFGATLLATTALSILHAPASFAADTMKPPMTKDNFKTQAEAATRAKALKCVGTHGSGTSWHPCKDNAAYEKAVKAAK